MKTARILNTFFAVLCLATLAGSLDATAQTSSGISRLIREAGSTPDEAARYGFLKQLEAQPELDAALRADLARLLPVVDDWANGKAKVVVDASRAAENGYLCRFISNKVQPSGAAPIHPPELSPDSPLYPIWCFYRGRMLLWRVIESGPLLRVPERRDAYYGEARRLLEVTRKAFPENRVVRMYLGEPIPWPRSRTAVPEAPEWASLQCEGLERLVDIILPLCSRRCCSGSVLGIPTSVSSSANG